MRSSRGLAFVLATCLVVSALTIRFFSVREDYPYYFMADMDLTVTIDSILIHSGYLPDHINHPGFGMYLLLTFSQKLASAANWISTLTLADLDASLNPLAGVVELTDFIQLHSPFLAIGLVLCLWAALCLMFRPSRLWALLVLVVLGSQESLIYHSVLVRSEFYALFFWSAALLLVALALRAERPGVVAFWLFGAGLVLGLCFLTKIQALFYVAVVPVILLFGLTSVSRAPLTGTVDGGRRVALAAVAAGVVNLLAFGALLAATSITTVPAAMAAFEYDGSNVSVAPYAVLLMLALLAIAATQLLLLSRAWTRTALFGLLALASWITLGFLGSFLLHLIALPNPAQALDYMLYDSNMLFFRGTYHEVAGLSEYAATAWSVFLFKPTILVAHLVLLGVLVLGHLRGWIPLSRAELGALAAMSACALLQVLLGTRWYLRDLLFEEILLNALSLIYALLIVQRAVGHRRLMTVVAACALLLLVANNLGRSNTMVTRLDANFNHRGFVEDRWFRSVYGGDQRLYAQLMNRRYPNAARRLVAREVADDHREVRRAVSFVFKNQTITHRNIGVFSTGFPVWAGYPGWKLRRAPDALRGAIVVDNGALPTHAGYAFEPAFVTGISEAMDKLRAAPENRIVALSRSDLRVFLFVQEADLETVSRLGFESGKHLEATLGSGRKTLPLWGVPVTNYTEIPRAVFQERFFFVVQRI